jgi:hypothetical protein
MRLRKTGTVTGLFMLWPSKVFFLSSKSKCCTSVQYKSFKMRNFYSFFVWICHGGRRWDMFIIFLSFLFYGGNLQKIFAIRH